MERHNCTYDEEITEYNQENTQYNEESIEYNEKSTAYNEESIEYNEKSTAYNEESIEYKENSPEDNGVWTEYNELCTPNNEKNMITEYKDRSTEYNAVTIQYHRKKSIIRQLWRSILYGGQFTLSTPLIKPNSCVLLPHRRSTTVSLETPFIRFLIRPGSDAVLFMSRT